MNSGSIVDRYHHVPIALTLWRTVVTVHRWLRGGGCHFLRVPVHHCQLVVPCSYTVLQDSSFHKRSPSLAFLALSRSSFSVYYYMIPSPLSPRSHIKKDIPAHLPPSHPPLLYYYSLDTHRHTHATAFTMKLSAVVASIAALATSVDATPIHKREIGGVSLIPSHLATGQRT